MDNSGNKGNTDMAQRRAKIGGEVRANGICAKQRECEDEIGKLRAKEKNQIWL